MSTPKACKDCGTTEPELHYLSGKMPRCYDCQRYANLKAKATGGSVDFSREEFVTWARAGPDRRRCAYCGIDRDRLHAMGVVNVRNKRPYESIGVDRKDNSGTYTLPNLVPCCGLCNAIKGSILSHDEMKVLGPVLATFWQMRLSDEAAT